MEAISKNDKTKASVFAIGINDEYVSKVGNQDYLRKYCSLDAESIANKILTKVTN